MKTKYLCLHNKLHVLHNKVKDPDYQEYASTYTVEFRTVTAENSYHIKHICYIYNEIALMYH